MAKKAGLFPVRRNARGEYEIEQGVVHGYPVSFNPDDDRFYVHASGDDGALTLARYEATERGWSNLIQFARRKGKSKE